MGSWSHPWTDLETARHFEALMAEPWIAEVTIKRVPDYGPDQPGDDLRFEDGEMRPYRRQGLLRRWAPVEPTGTKERVDWEVPELYDLYGDDELFDVLCDHADDLRASFDARPCIVAELRRLFDEWAGAEFEGLASEEELPALNVVRGVAGLPPL